MKTTLLTDVSVEDICKGFVYNELEGKGLFGWGGKLTEPIVDLLTKLRANVIEPVMVKGNLKEEDYKLLDEFAQKIIALHKNEALV